MTKQFHYLAGIKHLTTCQPKHERRLVYFKGLVCNHKAAVLYFFHFPSKYNQASGAMFKLLYANRLLQLLNNGFYHENFTDNQDRF